MGAALDKIQNQFDEISSNEIDNADSKDKAEITCQSEEETITEKYPFLDDEYWETAEAEEKARVKKIQKNRTLADMLANPLPGDIVVSKEDTKKFSMKDWLSQSYSTSGSLAHHYTPMSENKLKKE
ncbi:unnamed protein product [Auanema sp. JU1783]|nr:unnamed protein product [Auanema sp. JU1783]